MYKGICVHASETSPHVAIPGSANQGRLMGYACVLGNSHSDA